MAIDLRPTSETQIIVEAEQNFGPETFMQSRDSSPLVDALEAFYLHGCDDEHDGESDTFGHFYRVDRWIVWTDSQGFKRVETYDTEDVAHRTFVGYSDEFARTFDHPNPFED